MKSGLVEQRFIILDKNTGNFWQRCDSGLFGGAWTEHPIRARTFLSQEAAELEIADHIDDDANAKAIPATLETTISFECVLRPTAEDRERRKRLVDEIQEAATHGASTFTLDHSDMVLIAGGYRLADDSCLESDCPTHGRDQ